MAENPRVSVTIPLYNEEEGIPELHARISQVLEPLPGGPHELVLVNDGSVDGTAALLAELAERDPRVVVVSLSRNFGHQAAISAGLDHGSGDVVIVMDGDLQDDPGAIPDFLAAHAQGFDVVYARRVSRKEAPWLRFAYYAFYRLVDRLSEVRLPVDAGDFALMSRRVVDAIRSIPEHQRYLRGLRTWVGFRQVGIDVERQERWTGSSKYSFTRLVKLALDGIFAFSITPLRAAALLGVLSMGASGVFAGYAVYARLFLERSPQGFTALFLAVWFFSGLNLFFLGLIGEYVGRIYEEAKARPLYIVERVIRHEPGRVNDG